MNGYHEETNTKYDADSFVASPLLAAVTANNVSKLKRLISIGVSITESSGPHRRSPMMEAIFLSALPIIKILIDSGEDPNRSYGCDGFTAYHYAVMEELWASLAQLVREGGYPVTDDCGYSPLEMALSMNHWRCVSILELEQDKPGFWKSPENAIYGEAQKRLGRIRKPMIGTEGMRRVIEKWDRDRSDYESFAPSKQYLDDMGWFQREIESQKQSVYCCASRFQLAKMRIERNEMSFL